MLIVTLLQTLNNDIELFQITSPNCFTWEMDRFHKIQMELLNHQNYRNATEHFLRVSIKRKSGELPSGRFMQPSPQVSSSIK